MKQELVDWLEALRLKAEKATPGPWEGYRVPASGECNVSGPAQAGPIGPKTWVLATMTGIRTTRQNEDNALYIASLDPDAVRFLLRVVATAAETDRAGHCSDLCESMAPTRGCTCGGEAFRVALGNLEWLTVRRS